MTTVRLMDAPADYARFGVSPDHVEPWEDQRRDNDRAGVWEWWYFDALTGRRHCGGDPVLYQVRPRCRQEGRPSARVD
jgi:hypothetical protein